jgi:thiol-disulfide isomerase/thioredoxin
MPDKKDTPMATNERSQVVAPKANAQSVAPTSVAALVASAPAAPHKPRSLCGGQLDEGARAFPKKVISRAAAHGAEALPESVGASAGRWTWVNFWAAWCAPCKEEIPRLERWSHELTAAPNPLRVVFVSLDDDERQLSDFLEAQPASGLKATYWLKEGKEREDWLRAAGLNPDSALPFHLLVDPKGKIRCSIQGAIEDSDFPQLSALLDKSR